MNRHNVNCLPPEHCLCNTCKNDHTTCCSVEHEYQPCPVTECKDYEKEDA